MLDNLVNILLPNRDELLHITGKDSVEAALDALAPRVPLIVVKCGSAGALVQQGLVHSAVAPVAVERVDTIGAGDSFNAGFLHAWLQGKDAVKAAVLGNLTGALSTLRPGVTEAFRDTELVQRFLGGKTYFAVIDAGSAANRERRCYCAIFASMFTVTLIS